MFASKIISAHLRDHATNMKRQWAAMSEEDKVPYLRSHDADMAQYRVVHLVR